MITMAMIDNAIEIAKEEIVNENNPTKVDVRDFKNRLVVVLDSLEKEADDEPDEDDEDDEEVDDRDDQ